MMGGGVGRSSAYAVARPTEQLRFMSHPPHHRRHFVRGLPAVALAILLMVMLAACGSSPHPKSGLGPLPAYLPTTTQPVDRVVTASAAKPQLAAQGVAVNVDLAAGHVLALVSGPAVPPFVTPPPPAVTATFTVTLSRASEPVPVSLADFSITDQLGRTFEPSFVTGEAVPPATVLPGTTVTFQVTAVVPTGEGRIHWSPGGKPIVSWDFIVEDD
jgi:hypothetical protein